MLLSRPMDAASWTVIAVGAASFRSLRAEQHAHARRAHALAEDLRRRIDAQGAELGQLRERLASCDWTAAEDTAVRLADTLDSGDGGRRLVELASRLDRTVAEVRRAARLRRVEVDGGESFERAAGPTGAGSTSVATLTGNRNPS